MATTYKLTVFDSRISSLFDHGGPVQDFASDINRETLRLADRYVPKRSNTLRFAHRNFGVLKVGRYGARGRVGNIADYARFVHDGTTGPIFPLFSFAMTVPRTAGDAPVRHGGTNIMFVGPGFRKKSVAGQEANPWLELAGEQAAIRVANAYRMRGR